MKSFLTGFKPVSIKSRVTLLNLVILIVAITLSAFITDSALHDSISAEVELQQHSIAALQANHINDKLLQRLEALRKIADKISPRMLENDTNLQKFLEDRVVIAALFNTGVVVTDAKGTAIAAMPTSPKRIGVNYMDREHIRSALSQGKEQISEPVIGKILRTPLISLAVPIRSSEGHIIGAIAGGIDLANPNFFDDITDFAYGESGYFLLVDGKSRLIITSTQKEKVMVEQQNADIDALIRSHLQGGKTTGTTIDQPFGEVLVTVKAIPIADWYIVAALPTEEAFQPINAFHRFIAYATWLIVLSATVLIWWVLRALLSPIFDNLKVLTALADNPTQALTLPIHRDDEIGQLSAGFNTLLQKLRQQEADLRDSEFRWKFAIEGANDGLWDWDIAAGTVYFTKTWKAMLGFTEDEIGNGLNEWETRVHPDDMKDTLAAVALHFEGKTPFYSSEHRVKCKDGSYKWILDRGMVVSRDADNKPLRMIGTHSDIHTRRQMEEQIREMALHDSLTKLANRRLLKSRLEHGILRNKRHHCHSALLFLDLDNFKPINDNHGHDAGDLLLIDVAERLKDCVRATDTVSRIGGDEFVILLEHLHNDEASAQVDAIAVAEKIRARIAEPFIIEVKNADGQLTLITHSCTASIGVTVFGAAVDQEKVLKTADDAMYDAKENGRNQVRFRPMISP